MGMNRIKDGIGPNKFHLNSQRPVYGRIKSV